MTEPTIRFEDGAAYERGMGAWSLPTGTAFLDWLAPAPGLAWLDIGCGSGAFTELLLRHAGAAEADGIDPAPAQLAFARARPGAAGARFHQGDAMALPFPADRFDAAAMALVIFFVPDPARGVAEMVRVVRPGGLVAAYAWDMAGGGFPFAPIRAALRECGHATLAPPSPDASDIAAMAALWSDTGLDAVATTRFEITRRFADFDAFWAVSTITGSLRASVAGLDPAALARVKEATRARVAIAPDGSVTRTARANAVRGIVTTPPRPPA
ncbi:MAG: methyltransferase domain-containing protein [Rhodospirillales bacterium]|nr:methyltransferase domain-containing protein [Rhodospirillales bacterium]